MNGFGSLVICLVLLVSTGCTVARPSVTIDIVHEGTQMHFSLKPVTSEN